MSVSRRVRPFGDAAVLVEVPSVAEAHDLAAALTRAEDCETGGADTVLDAVLDVVVGLESLTVVFDPHRTDPDDVTGLLLSLPAAPGTLAGGRVHDIAVAFCGPDLDEVAAVSGLGRDDVVDLLVSTELHVAFVGFTPGFGYLLGLPPALASVPRRATPRPSVAAGSVAVAGGFAGIYPRATPGGWNLVGRTDASMFDPGRPPYARLAAGDRVRLRPDASASAAAGVGDEPARVTPDGLGVRSAAGSRDLLVSGGPRRAVVEAPGALSTVQDGGRFGVASIGVPRAGACDPGAMVLANRLVGNDDGDAVVEATLSGPTLRFASDAHVAVVGDVESTLDGFDVGRHGVVPVTAGQRLTVGKVRRGSRAVVAVDGGIDTPVHFGSRSTDVLSGLGPGPLRAGDQLGLGPRRRPAGRIRPSPPPPDAPRAGRLRVLVGPDPFDPAAVGQLLAARWEVSATSDRVGVRLLAPAPIAAPVGAGRSRGMVTGAVQVPPDGRPIVLLCDHATVGGYPVIATVITADLGVLGQCRPGDTVGFAAVDLATAAAARAASRRHLDAQVVGRYPTQAG